MYSVSKRSKEVEKKELLKNEQKYKPTNDERRFNLITKQGIIFQL